MTDNNAQRRSRPRLVDDPLGYLAARSALQPNGCVLWTAGQTTKGHGQAGHSDLAHRVAWGAYFGEVPRGMYVVQRCGNNLCIARGCLYLTKWRRPRVAGDHHTPVRAGA